ncbi:hypothetical protein Tco_1119808 [Tanacetum coccineum]
MAIWDGHIAELTDIIHDTHLELKRTDSFCANALHNDVLRVPGGPCRRMILGTDNQEKDEKQSQNDKTGLGMEKTVKDKAKSKPESQSSQKVNRKVNWSKSKSTQVNLEAKVKEI